MSEVPLYMAFSHKVVKEMFKSVRLGTQSRVQGFLNHKKHSPCRTLQ